MRHISLKSIICHMFATSVCTEPLKGNQVFFLTSAGLVSGVPIASKETSDSTSDNLTVMTSLKLLELANTQLDKEFRIPETDRTSNDGYVFLQDAKVYPNDLSDPLPLPSLVLFTSEIVGVFLGSLPQPSRE